MNKEEVVQLNKLKRKTGLFFIIVMGVMLICFNFLIQFEVNKEKISASYTAEDTVRKIETQLGRYLENSEMLKNIISSKHTISDEQFNQLASYMKKNKNVIEAYELAPNGIIEKAYPLKGNEKVIGMNTLELPERQKEANIARKSGEYTIAGPYELKQGGTGALLFDPIYINDGNEKKFWGFSILVLNWDAFLEELEVDKLEDATYHFKVWKEGNKGKHVTIMSCGHSSLNHTLSVACEVPNDTWYFEIVPFQGWIPMSYKIFGSIVSVLVAILLSMGYWQIILRREKEAVYAKQIEKVSTEAQHANQAKTRFLFSMSHDIRTPMNAIIGMTSLIRHDAGNKAKVIEYADKIDISSQHLLGIINDVLDMSKIEAGKTVFKYTDFSILDFITELNTIFHSQIDEKNQTLIIIKENIRHEWVNGDQVHLMQIFSNLVSNAVKYTQEGGKIQFLVEECETKSSVYAKYRFLVSDNGMGMSADFKDTIFDAFTRAESSMTNKIQGTGLGMAITKNLVEAMGGTIDVESELSQGSCFEVLIDLRIAEDRFVSSAEQAEKDEPAGNVLKGMRFLCAEDNELNAEILMELLKIEGAECTICENGKRVLEAFEQSAPGDYDMILMDVQMPVMNGYEATKAIRRSSHELAKTIPIIAMTANAFSEDIQHSLAAGMNAHVSKPIEMKVLEKTIRSIKSGGGHRNATH